MKDTQTKTPPLLVPKPKSAIKKEKSPAAVAKKPKEAKNVAAKTPRGRKPNAKVSEKKPKINNVKAEVPKRKRGRPKSEGKCNNNSSQVKMKEPKQKGIPGRKRKMPDIVIKTEKEDVSYVSPPPQKKSKGNDGTNHTMNGNSKMSFMPPETLPMFVNHSIANNVNSNGVYNHFQNGIPDFGPKKQMASKSATFQPGSTKSATFQPGSSKSVTFQPSPTNNSVFNNGCNKPFKPLSTTNKNIKGILKNETTKNNSSKGSHSPPKQNAIMQIAPKDIKVEEGVIIPYKSPAKLHPQRMASLDAMAKMHVICIPDRKPIEHHSKATTSSSSSSVVTTVCAGEPFTHQKSSLTHCHQRIQFDVKKESKQIVHKQVFVSRSVEQSSKTISTSTKSETKKKTKKLTAPPSSKTTSKDNKLSKGNASSKTSSKTSLSTSPVKKKSKTSKDQSDKKSAKTQNKSSATKSTKKPVKEKPTSNKTKKTKKMEQTKSEVKVKETIRMQKTCTYQSVTTVNSHGTANSSVVPVGLTTNYSKTKKTVVTDEECGKNKIDYSTDSMMDNAYCESPCSVGHRNDCCKFHATAHQIIPFAHVQTCGLGHSLSRTSSETSGSHCDGNFAMHRFGHQPAVVYSPPSPDYGCCCSGPLVPSVHDPCLVRKGLLTYPTHRHAPTGFDCDRHFAIPSPSRCCCDALPPSSNCLQYMSGSSTGSSGQPAVLPCEPSPLDLSLSSGSSSDVHIQQGLFHNQLCCPAAARKVLVLRSPGGFQHAGPSGAGCYKFIGASNQTSCETHATSELIPKPTDVSNKASSAVIPPIAAASGYMNVGASTSGLKNVAASTSGIKNVGASTSGLKNVGASTSGLKNVGASTSMYRNVGASTSGLKNVEASTSMYRNVGASTSGLKSVCASTSKALLPTKKEKASAKAQVLKHVPKRKQFAHGWTWKGTPKEKMISLANDAAPCPRLCYPSVEHQEGDVIHEKDCVLLRSGTKDTDLPYVAKVATFWEDPEDGEMMMSLLWYYRPEHTDLGDRKWGHLEDEVFASRHRDVNSVACIEDKCYVLTHAEYCRHKAKQNMDNDMIPLSKRLVPDLPDGYPRKSRIPQEMVATDIIFFCKHVYDFRQKRILKNPT